MINGITVPAVAEMTNMIYVFDHFELNTHLYTLSRPGQTVRLRPKVFQLLLYLLEHRDRVVSKQELEEEVWPDQFISHATLESTVRLLRQALGDSGRAQRIIQTTHGYGYRFAAQAAVPAKKVETPSLSQSIPPGSTPPGHQHVGPQDVTSSRTQASTEQKKREAERRQLTVMVCDLVEAVPLSEQLGLEDLHDVIQAYQEMCTDVIRCFDGHIAQNFASGVLVYFGYPHAHEDDARRAAHAGLKIVEALRTLNARLAREKGVQLAVHLGIHTGLVVIGNLGGDQRHDALALGDTPNIATHIQNLAAPDTVVISAATAHLVEGYFVLQSLDRHILESVLTPVLLFQVLGLSGAQSRLDVASGSGLTPFVGREAELSLLLERWCQAKDGMGHVVLLGGEAGIGKSRLVQIMKDRIAEDTYIRLECRGSPYHQQSALYPVIELLRHVFQWRSDDKPDESLKKLETVLTRYDLPLQNHLPLFATLLALPIPDDLYPPLSLTPQQQRQKTLQAILEVVLRLAAQQPVLLIVEDLHWLDPSTLALLTLLVEQTPTAPICLLFTHRPEFQVPWSNRSYLSQVTLLRLPRQQVEQMVMCITGRKPLPTEVLQQVLDKTDGVPLFVEELIKMILDTEQLRELDDRYELAAPLPTLTIPTTLHDSLMARLDRLDTAKGMAQLGAVIGRQFPYALIRDVARQDEGSLQHELERLVKAELVYQHGLPPQATYVFKHALIQETAYQSLSKRIRQYYHDQIAQALIERFSDTIELQPELLAHHYTEASRPEKALPYWQRAGQHALERSAYIEAISHLTQGLASLATLPDVIERPQQELMLQIALGRAFMATKGYGAPEVGHAYARARTLCDQMGETPQLFSVWRGLSAYYYMRAEFQTARELGEQCLALAQRIQDPTLLLRSHLTLGQIVLFLGDYPLAYEHFMQGRKYASPQPAGPRVVKAIQDPEVTCYALAGPTLWLLGYPERALRISDEAITLARQLTHPFSLAEALIFAAVVCLSTGKAEDVMRHTAEAIAIAEEQGFPHWQAHGEIYQGWALTMQGERENGITHMCRGQAIWQAIGGELARPWFLALLADAYGHTGQFQAGITVLEEALRVIEHHGERHYESEIYRLRGELLYKANPRQNTTKAENDFRLALEISRRQEAKSLELRAAISLSRLLLQLGKRASAHQTLTQRYNGFTEGWNTGDLQTARALIEELLS